MNIAMEQTEEHVGGVMTNRYGDAFIRGNNGAFCLLLSDVLQPSYACLPICEVLYISAAETL
jgi:hypothetical protein